MIEKVQRKVAHIIRDGADATPKNILPITRLNNQQTQRIDIQFATDCFVVLGKYSIQYMQLGHARHQLDAEVAYAPDSPSFKRTGVIAPAPCWMLFVQVIPDLLGSLTMTLQP